MPHRPICPDRAGARPVGLAALTLALLLGGLPPEGVRPLAPLAAEDWPQWLGPRGDGSATGVLPAEGPVRLRKLWQRPVEKAGAALTVVGDRVYTLEAHDGVDVAVALEAATGREVWRTPLGPAHPRALDEYGPRSTPAVADGRVFAIATRCRLVALDAKTGRELWAHSLREKFGSPPQLIGCHTSPLLAGDRLVVQASGATENRLVALAPATGEVIWTSKGIDRTASTSPVLAEIAGERQVVVHYRAAVPDGPAVSGLYGARLADGAVRWDVRVGRSISSDTPLVLPGDRVAIQTWADVRLYQIRKEGDRFQAAEVWVSDAIRSNSGPAVHHGGHLFGFGQELLVCLDAATGKPLWKEKLYAGTVAVADGHLVVVSPTGLLHVAAASPAGYRERARLEIFSPGPGGEAPPSFAGRRIFVRTAGEIVAVEVGG